MKKSDKWVLSETEVIHEPNSLARLLFYPEINRTGNDLVREVKLSLKKTL